MPYISNYIHEGLMQLERHKARVGDLMRLDVENAYLRSMKMTEAESRRFVSRIMGIERRFDRLMAKKRGERDPFGVHDVPWRVTHVSLATSTCRSCHESWATLDANYICPMCAGR